MGDDALVALARNKMWRWNLRPFMIRPVPWWRLPRILRCWDAQQVGPLFFGSALQETIKKWMDKPCCRAFLRLGVGRSHTQPLCEQHSEVYQGPSGNLEVTDDVSIGRRRRTVNWHWENIQSQKITTQRTRCCSSHLSGASGKEVNS
jgi:hypothetical protein